MGGNCHKLCPPDVCILNPNPQCGGVRRWGPWGVDYIKGRRPHEQD